jgi:hypothetical protein
MNEDLINLAVKTLNEAFAADPAAMHCLVKHRIPCNETLADHPTIQVSTNQFGETERFAVGLTGILNGILEPATGKRIAFMISDDGEGTLTGFTIYTPPVAHPN